MTRKTEATGKKTVVSAWGDSRKFRMSESGYTGVVVGKEATDGEYVITDAIVEPGGDAPEHYHKWEDQTFHVIEGEIEARIGGKTWRIGKGDTIHCPRGVSHYVRNTGDTTAMMISYVVPGHWAEDYMAETARQSQEGKPDLDLIEERFGVVYI